jgi:carbon monoxide dehydrogenase subunit G
MDTLTNEFTVNRPIDQTWAILTDVERIAPCLPGAELQEIEGDTYRGVVKVKLGPISTAFKGQATFVSRNDADHQAVLHGEGRDTGGKGNAEAMITASLESVSDSVTKCVVSSDIKFTGKVAQFGRLGVVRETSEKLMKQFATNLNTMLDESADQPARTPAAAPSAASSDAASAGDEPTAPTVRKVNGPTAEAIDLGDVVPGVALAKKVVPFVGGLALLLLIFKRLRRAR